MVCLILLAGGDGKRVGGEVAKQHIVVRHRQIIEYTLTAFSRSEYIDRIVVVSKHDYISEVERLRGKFDKIIKVVSGGDTRIQSVKNGVVAISSFCNDNDKVIVSDAARPCITLREIGDLVASLDNYLATTTGIESYETIIKKENNEVQQIIPRNGLIRQTSPEGYRYSALKWLYLNASEEIISSYKNVGIDQLFGSGSKIGIVPSNPLNFKITTEEDLRLFDSVLKHGFDNIIQG